ncbi:hypothetical protein M0802_001047 [Mischocyttarus mexicanus]|nr:hypothetical protein M0802_001047 [Mischocyttarus mexicanus]
MKDNRYHRYHTSQQPSRRSGQKACQERRCYPSCKEEEDEDGKGEGEDEDEEEQTTTTTILFRRKGY